VSASTSEATRPSSVLDERIRTQVRAQVRLSRRRQGLPEHVQDITVLDRLAGRLLERVAERTEPTWAGNDDAATRRDQGREASPVAVASGAVPAGEPPRRETPPCPGRRL
jgi:hypothetical protein